MATRGPQLHRLRRDWTPLLFCASLLAWIAVSLLFVNKLTLFQGFPGFKGDLSGAPVGGPVPSAQLLQEQQLPVQHQADDAAARDRAAQLKAAAAAGEDIRISGLSPPLDEAALHGGWHFTREMYDLPTKHPNVTVVSWSSPRVLHIKNFLTPEEVEHLIKTAEAGFQRSEVVSDTQSTVDSRTSYGAWLNGPRRTDLVKEIQYRIYQLTLIPEEFGESIYVLRYATGQKYEAHTDHCHHSAGEQLTESCRGFLRRAGGPVCGAGGGGVSCGDRLATVVLYLQSPSRGGATVFPHATNYHLPPGSMSNRVEAAETSRRRLRGEDAAQPLPLPKGAKAKAGAGGAAVVDEPAGAMPWYCQEDAEVLKVLPKPGDAVLFYDYTPSDANNGLAQADPTSLHAGCPPLEGTKLIATRWMRTAEFH